LIKDFIKEILFLKNKRYFGRYNNYNNFL